MAFAQPALLLIAYLLAYVILSVVPVLAAQCAVNSPTSNSPCCNIAQLGSSTQFWFSSAQSSLYGCESKALLGNPYVVCGSSHASDTVSAAQQQSAMDQMFAFCSSNQCFGGEVASAPGDSVKSAGSVESAVSRLKISRCNANFDYVLSGAFCYCDCCSGASCSTQRVGNFATASSSTCLASTCRAQFPATCNSSL